MLPLALVVVVLGGVGSLLGALIGSILIGFLYVVGQEYLPSMAYVIIFLPMVVVLALRPKGLFGRVAA
jgi:branched-chain amino acid transport system permease protein